MPSGGRTCKVYPFDYGRPFQLRSLPGGYTEETVFALPAWLG